MLRTSHPKLRQGLEAIQDDLDEAVRYLSRWTGVKRIWLFGGAAKGRPLDWRSDLDFAVEGLPAADWECAWSELDQRLALPVDLVRWESASLTLRAEVQRWGKILYEA